MAGPDPSSTAHGTRLDDLRPLVRDLPDVARRAAIPRGFRAGALAAGIKPSGKPDMGVIATTGEPAAVAAVFTTQPGRRGAGQALAGSPQCDRDRRRRPLRLGRWHRDHLRLGECRDRAPRATPTRSRSQGCWRVCCVPARNARWRMSTGVIGVRLPMTRIEAGLARLVPQLAESSAGLEAVAGAMMTTDKVVKLATTTVELSRPGRDAGDRDRVWDRQGRGHDPPAHGHDAERDPDRRRRRPGNALRTALTHRAADLEPAQRRRRHEHQRHRLPDGVGRGRSQR